MKNQILKIASTLTILMTISAPAMANEKMAAVNNRSMMNMANITPFNLVSGAYRGQFKNSGIPSYNQFNVAVKTGKIDSKTLIQKAIDNGRLDSAKINDQGYINSVKSFLQDITQD